MFLLFVRVTEGLVDRHAQLVRTRYGLGVKHPV